MEAGELPVGWARALVCDVGTAVTGNTPSTQNPSNYGGQIPFVKPPQLNDLPIGATKEFLSELGAQSARVLPPFSILVSCIGNLGKTGLNKAPVAFNQQINAIVPAGEVSALFLFYQVQSHDFRSQLEAKATATTISIVNKGNFETVKLNIAPAAEQHRIVAKIEELFSELDQGVASLKTTREQIKVYRQSLLKNAFGGKLTAAWRAAHRDQLETASALQQRIARERQARYQQQLADWQTAGQPGPKPKPPKPLPPLTAEELAELPELPDGWGWVRLETIQAFGKHAVKAGPFGSALKKEFYVSDGFKIYGQEQVIRGDHAYGDYFISESKYADLSSCAVRPFDVLISLVGTIGKVLVLPELASPGIINPRLVKISLNLEAYEPAFFKAYFESGFLRSLYATESQGTTMDILNLGMIQGLPYPLCSLEEQREILSVLDAKLSEADQLDQTLATALQQADALRQSILKKAFHGQLVKQAKNEEPATALLERIRAARTASPGKGRQAKMGSKLLPDC